MRRRRTISIKSGKAGHRNSAFCILIRGVFMKKIDLIALDLDGTLLDRDHSTVPARNVEALRAGTVL